MNTVLLMTALNTDILTFLIVLFLLAVTYRALAPRNHHNIKGTKNYEEITKDEYTTLSKDFRKKYNPHTSPHQPLLTPTPDRSGYVYVISNPHSFDENIVKIGMTQRPNPLDRIEELNRAVPHDYDVHMIIHTSDARALENSLHHHFKQYQVPNFPLGREFFYVTPEDVQQRLSHEQGCRVVLTH